MATLKEIKNELEKQKGRGAWNMGVLSYAWELFENIEQREKNLGLNDINYPAAALDVIMLNGADTWHDYSYGGCSFIYDIDIARTLCNSTELKRLDNGRKQPNSKETWLDVQARALYQAAYLIKDIAWKIDIRKQVNA